MPKAIKKKTKKRSVGTEVDVKDRLSEIRESVQEKQKTVFTYVIIIVIGALLVGGILYYRHNSRMKSQNLASEAYKIYYNEYQATPLPDQERYQKALDLFKQAYDKKDSPRLLLYIGSSYYELGKYDEALAAFNVFLKKYSAEKDTIVLAYEKIAQIYLRKGNATEALKTLDTLYNADTPLYKDYALIHAGRILEKEGRKEEAKAKFKELADKFPDSPFVGEAESLLGEIKEPQEVK